MSNHIYFNLFLKNITTKIILKTTEKYKIVIASIAEQVKSRGQ